MNSDNSLNFPALFPDMETDSLAETIDKKKNPEKDIVKTPHVQDSTNDKVSGLLNDAESGEAFDFVLSPPDQEILSIEIKKDTSLNSSNSSSDFNSKYSGPIFPTIDTSFFEEEDECVSGKEIGIEEIVTHSPEINKKMNDSEAREYYLTIIKKFQSRIDTSSRTSEISGVAALLFYMADGMDIFFNYEQKWKKHKEKYILQANLKQKREGKGGCTNELAYAIFLEKIGLFKSQFLTELTYEMSAHDMLFYMTDESLCSGDEEIDIKSFQEKYKSEFENIFTKYFEKLQILRDEKKTENQELMGQEVEKKPRKITQIVSNKNELLERIGAIENYFDEHVFSLINESDEGVVDSTNHISRQVNAMREKIEKKRKERNIK